MSKWGKRPYIPDSNEPRRRRRYYLVKRKKGSEDFWEEVKGEHKVFDGHGKFVPSGKMVTITMDHDTAIEIMYTLEEDQPEMEFEIRQMI